MSRLRWHSVGKRKRNIAPASEALPFFWSKGALHRQDSAAKGGLPHERLALTLLAQEALDTIAHYWKNRNIDWFSHLSAPFPPFTRGVRGDGERGSRANVEIKI